MFISFFKKSFEYVSRNKVQLLNLFYLVTFFTLASLIISFLSAKVIIGDRRILFNDIFALPFFLTLTIPAVISSKFKTAYFKIIIPFILLQFGIELFFILHYHAPFGRGYMEVIASASRTEMLEYVKSFSLSNIAMIASMLVAFLALSILAVKFFLRHCNYGKFSGIYTICILLCVIFSSVFLKMSGKNAFERLLPIRTFFDYCDFKKTNADYINIVANPTLPDNITQDDDILGVIIVGESDTRNNHSLYGYKRNTDPMMSKLKSEIVLFNNIIGTASTTSPAIRNAFLMKGINAWSASFVDLFKKVKIEVNYMSSQHLFTAPNAPSRVIFTRAKIYTPPLNVKVDEDFINPWVRDVKLFENKGASLSVLHLSGSHQPYHRRYPKKFGSFTNSTDFSAYPDADKLSATQKNILNQYDNSIEYNDMLLYKIIEYAREQKKAAFIFYISDHGECPTDNTASFRHSKNFHPEIWEIPAFIWFSPEYEKKYPNIVKESRANANVPFQSYNLSYTIFDLMRLNFDNFPSYLSLVSPHLKPQTNRLILDGYFNYDTKKYVNPEKSD